MKALIWTEIENNEGKRINKRKNKIRLNLFHQWFFSKLLQTIKIKNIGIENASISELDVDGWERKP